MVGSGPYRMSSPPEVEQFTSEAQGRTNQRFLHRLFGKLWGATPKHRDRSHEGHAVFVSLNGSE